MRIKSNNRGDTFKSSLTFKSAVQTTPGVKYVLSMYTMINCGSNECATEAQDSISVKIKQGDDDFNEVFLIERRSIDSNWVNHYLIIEAISNKIRVYDL